MVFEYPVHNMGITLNEVPNKVAVFIEFNNCHLRCKGCHSPHLHSDMFDGKKTDIKYIISYVEKQIDKGAEYIVLMGGDNNNIMPHDLYILINKLSEIAPVMLYSGSEDTSILTYTNLTLLKTGGYSEELGGLLSPTTNQKVFKKEIKVFPTSGIVATQVVPVDITEEFVKEMMR